MDLTIFHSSNPDGSPRNFRMKDKLNGSTKLGSCRFLELTGWYNYSLAQRLLGHYRLFQHFKAHYSNQQSELSAVQAYILRYRSTHGSKYYFFRLFGLLNAIRTPREKYSVTQVVAVNQILVNDGSGILQEFLAGADIDFAAAFTRAIQQINDPAFLDTTAIRPVNLTVTQYNQYETKRNVDFHPLITHQTIIKEGAKGKEKGVLSKWQSVMFLDLLSELGGMEKMDLSNKTKHANIAVLLHAITGKSKESFAEELDEYRNRGLYECSNDGEIDQLIIVLTNLAEPFKQAGFKAFSDLVDDKIRALRQKKKR